MFAELFFVVVSDVDGGFGEIGGMGKETPDIVLEVVLNVLDFGRELLRPSSLEFDYVIGKTTGLFHARTVLRRNGGEKGSVEAAQVKVLKQYSGTQVRVVRIGVELGVPELVVQEKQVEDESVPVSDDVQVGLAVSVLKELDIGPLTALVL